VRALLPLIAVIAIAACSAPSSAPNGEPASEAAAAGVTAQPSIAGATETPAPSVAATPSSFTSPLYGYTLTLPAGWRATAAVLPWDGRARSSHDEPDVDKFVGPVNATAWAFAGSISLDLAGFVQDRIAANARDHGDTCPATPEVNEPIQIDGEPGVLLGWNCGLLINEAVTVHRGTGFAMVMRDFYVHAATDLADRALLEDLLNSISFPS
jgi:hypothetical protein